MTRGLINPFQYSGSNIVLRATSAITGYVSSRFTHSYFDVTPDNPQDFEGKTNFQLGGYASDGIFNPESKLEYHEGWENGNSQEYSRVLLNTPEGKSDTEFINGIIDQGSKINGAGIPYDALPGNPLFGSGENSNSFATSAIEETGSSLPSGTSYQSLAHGVASPGLGRSIDYSKYFKNQNKPKGIGQYYQKFKSFFKPNKNKPK